MITVVIVDVTKHAPVIVTVHRIHIRRVQLFGVKNIQLDPVKQIIRRGTVMTIEYTDELPNESGYYYHKDNHGHEEIVKLKMIFGIWYIHKFDGSEIHIENDKGRFGPRIELPSEEY